MESTKKLETRGFSVVIGDRPFKNVTKKFNVELFYTDSWLKPNIFLIEFVFFCKEDFTTTESDRNKKYLNWIEKQDYNNLILHFTEDKPDDFYIRPLYWCDESEKFLKVEDDRLWELIMDEILDHAFEQMNLDEHEKDSEIRWQDVIELPASVELKDITEVDTLALF